MWLLSNKEKIKDSGLLSGFCDYHCHLLPGVDDGVQEMSESLDILKLWEGVGIKEIWLTPHVMEDIPNKIDTLRERFEEFGQAYNGTITLRLGAENMLDNLFTERFSTGDVLTIDSRMKKLLVETSYYNPPINMREVIEGIKEQGYTPVLAHPERYQYMMMNDYTSWKAKGLLFQLNIPSVVGMYGLAVQRKTEELLKKGYYDCVGTDTHSIAFAEDFLESLLKKQIIKEIKTLIKDN